MSKRTHAFNWVLDPGKFLSKEEAKRLLETAKERAQLAVARGRRAPVRDYFIVDLAMSTGLRVMEVARLICGDIFIQDGRFSLLVRKGKGGKRRLVRFSGCPPEKLRPPYPCKTYVNLLHAADSIILAT